MYMYVTQALINLQGFKYVRGTVLYNHIIALQKQKSAPFSQAHFHDTTVFKNIHFA